MTPRTLTASTLLATFLLAGVAFADDPGTGTGSGRGKKNPKTIDLPCVQEIVRKRDDAIIGALGAYTASLTGAFSTRRDALVSAWGIEDRKERKKAINAAWKTFKTSKKAAEKAFKEARRSAWKTFDADRKTCRGSDEAKDSNVGE